jgi:DNA-directed RNA polymerase subunit RPC12/RpoP
MLLFCSISSWLSIQELSLRTAHTKSHTASSHDPGFLVDTVLGQLSGGTLDRIRCGFCGAEFVMLKRAQKAVQGTGPSKKTPMRCPDCGVSSETVVITSLGSTLKKVIVKGIPTLEISRTTPPKKENQSDQPESGK